MIYKIIILDSNELKKEFERIKAINENIGLDVSKLDYKLLENKLNENEKELQLIKNELEIIKNEITYFKNSFINKEVLILIFKLFNLSFI